MDDDVKNLFQKFGQPATAYQEISREVESEQAKKRWPLLRDVRVHTIPDHSVSESEEFSETSHVMPSPKQEIIPGAHRKSLVNRDNGVDVQNVSNNFTKKKVIVPSALTPPASPGMFRPEPQQKMAFSKLEGQSQKEVNSLFGSPANTVNAMDVQPEYQKKAVVRPAHADKHHPVSEVFKRLAGQLEPARSVESPVNSFFKKIFKS